jgi:hypothetical protein
VRIYQSSLSITEPEHATLKVVPNPATDELSLMCPSGATSARILNMHGQVVRELSVGDRVHRIPDLPAGPYIIEVQAQGRPVQTLLQKI